LNKDYSYNYNLRGDYLLVNPVMNTMRMNQNIIQILIQMKSLMMENLILMRITIGGVTMIQMKTMIGKTISIQMKIIIGKIISIQMKIMIGKMIVLHQKANPLIVIMKMIMNLILVEKEQKQYYPPLNNNQKMNLLRNQNKSQIQK